MERINEIIDYSNRVQELFLRVVKTQEDLQQLHMHILLVLDDVVGEVKSMEWDQALLKLFFNRRHHVANGTVNIITIT